MGFINIEYAYSIFLYFSLIIIMNHKVFILDLLHFSAHPELSLAEYTDSVEVKNKKMVC